MSASRPRRRFATLASGAHGRRCSTDGGAHESLDLAPALVAPPWPEEMPPRRSCRASAGVHRRWLADGVAAIAGDQGHMAPGRLPPVRARGVGFREGGGVKRADIPDAAVLALLPLE